VYWQIAAIAAIAGVDTVSVETFPHFDLAAVLSTADRAGSVAVVLPAPLKLQGAPGPWRKPTSPSPGCSATPRAG